MGSAPPSEARTQQFAYDGLATLGISKQVVRVPRIYRRVYNQDNGAMFAVMEYIKAPSLHQMIQRDPDLDMKPYCARIGKGIEALLQIPIAEHANPGP